MDKKEYCDKIDGEFAKLEKLIFGQKEKSVKEEKKN